MKHYEVLQVNFEHDGHRFVSVRDGDRQVSIYVDGKFWRTEANLFRDIPDDKEWVISATKGAWDFAQEAAK